MIRTVHSVIALIVMCIAWNTVHAAEIYMWTDSNGVAHFSDHPPETGKGAIYDPSNKERSPIEEHHRGSTERTIQDPSAAVAAPQIPAKPNADENKRLISAFRAKFDNPEYVKRKNADGIPSTPQDFPEEELIKKVRGRIAANITAPSNARVIEIPVTGDLSLKINGQLGRHEWGEAITVPIGIQGAVTTLLLVSDGERLFLGLDAFDEKTASGFDQFRFYWHVRLTPEIENERLHVRHGGHPRVLRQTNIRYKHKPGEVPIRWMKFPVTDWDILPKAEGASSLRKHRQYEASIPLDEAGLHIGIPFAARFEVETDPERENDGSFRKRVYLGALGSQNSPVWLRVESAR